MQSAEALLFSTLTDTHLLTIPFIVFSKRAMFSVRLLFNGSWKRNVHPGTGVQVVLTGTHRYTNSRG